MNSIIENINHSECLYDFDDACERIGLLTDMSEIAVNGIETSSLTSQKLGDGGGSVEWQLKQTIQQIQTMAERRHDNRNNN